MHPIVHHRRLQMMMIIPQSKIQESKTPLVNSVPLVPAVTTVIHASLGSDKQNIAITPLNPLAAAAVTNKDTNKKKPGDILPLYFFVKTEEEAEKCNKLNVFEAFEKKVYVWDTLPQVTKTDSINRALHRLFIEWPPAYIYTIGECGQFGFMEMVAMHYPIRVKWFHFDKPEQIRVDWMIPGVVATNLIHDDKPANSDNPILSIISSSYKSVHRIQRPYQSCLNSTYKNWEWIIVDDSDDGDDVNWNALRQLASTDMRIRAVRCSHHSGYIGNMKAIACSLSRGSWLIEIDHDDSFHPHMLQWIVDAAKANPDVGFIFTDFCEVFEPPFPGGPEGKFCYGEKAGFGFSAYMHERVKGAWQCVYKTHGMNPWTSRNITGVPNHARIFRRDIYQEVQGYNPALPVADDYDLLLRMFFKSKCRWLRIPEMAYIQYRNAGGNNFTNHRNSLIHYITNMIHSGYEGRIRERFKELNIPDDGGFFNQRKSEDEEYDRDFEFPKQRWPLLEKFWIPGNENDQIVSIIMPTFKRIPYLRKAIASVIAQDYTHWRLFVVGDHCPDLQGFMEKEIFDPRISWWNMERNYGSGGAEPRNYVMNAVVRTKWCAFLDDDNTWESNHLSSLWRVQKRCAAASSTGGTLHQGPRCIMSSMKINGRPLWFHEPKKGRADTSCLFIETQLWYDYGNMKDRIQGGYAHDWELINRWVQGGEPFAVTLLPTVNYTIDTNQQSYEEIYNFYPDQPKLSKLAQQYDNPHYHLEFLNNHNDWNVNPLYKPKKKNTDITQSAQSETTSSGLQKTTKSTNPKSSWFSGLRQYLFPTDNDTTDSST